MIVTNGHGNHWQGIDTAEPEITHNQPTNSTICLKSTVFCFDLPLRINFQHFHCDMCNATESDKLAINTMINIFHGKKSKHGSIKCSTRIVAKYIETDMTTFKNIYFYNPKLIYQNHVVLDAVTNPILFYRLSMQRTRL